MGEIAGNYFEPASNPYDGKVRAFVRTAFGSYQTFDAAVSSPDPTFTYVTAINSAGEVTGYDWDQDNVFHGYTRDVNGTVTLFDAPGAALTSFNGTHPTSINLAGTVVGYYTDANGIYHGFIRTPPAGY